MYPGWYQEGREGPMEFILKHEKVWKRVGIIGGVYLGMKYLVPLMIPFLIAALAAHGIIEITNVQYIERGYEDVIGKIQAVGGRIRSVEIPEEELLVSNAG